MRKTFWYIVGGQLTTISIPAMAQDVGADPAHSVQNHSAHQQVQNTDQTPAHSAAMEAWPVERKAAQQRLYARTPRVAARFPETIQTG